MAKIQGSFDHGSRLAYVAVRANAFSEDSSKSMALEAILFFSLIVFFLRFSDSSDLLNLQPPQFLLSYSAVSDRSGRLVSTIVHEFSHRDLFPDDIAITISTGNTTASSQELVPYTTRKLR
ncbi:hypothetical protein OIU78_017227 [Salix suchowensis]|nr:hypothetical protein OIU78_017227 [Salix suchowensis]